jgi:5-(carboxyamino)imidazole ribonucleotide synthase
MTTPLLPGATIGMLGGGQLGRMFALAAKRMGYRVHVYSPERHSPAGQVADLEMNSRFHDTGALEAFAKKVDVVTLEFENIPAEALEAISKHVPVYPGVDVLHTTQHRLREKDFLSSRGFPVTPYAAVDSSLDDLYGAIGAVGYPAVLKTAGFGYDGKGQARLNNVDDAPKVFPVLEGQQGILEKLVQYRIEFSVIAARGLNGEIAVYEPIENHHVNHILDVSLCPAGLSWDQAQYVQQIARNVLEALDVIGVMCLEFFMTEHGEMLINELAPRPHNSGHLTLEAMATSQFEQQLRAICGLPLGSTERLKPAAMANLLGDLWPPDPAAQPDWPAAMRDSRVMLHLYGKAEARPGRKMGHLTAVANSAEEARDIVLNARHALTPAPVEPVIS